MKQDITEFYTSVCQRNGGRECRSSFDFSCAFLLSFRSCLMGSFLGGMGVGRRGIRWVMLLGRRGEIAISPCYASNPGPPFPALPFRPISGPDALTFLCTSIIVHCPCLDALPGSSRCAVWIVAISSLSSFFAPSFLSSNARANPSLPLPSGNPNRTTHQLAEDRRSNAYLAIHRRWYSYQEWRLNTWIGRVDEMKWIWTDSLGYAFSLKWLES